MVHRRTVGGEEIVLGNQGALWGNAMTWWDHDTGSVWSQPLGRAILGPRVGQALELLPSTLTRWGTWREAYPDTLALDVGAGRSGFTLSSMAIVVDFGTDAVAFPVGALRAEGPANDVVAGLAVAVVFDPTDDERWTVFSRRLDGRVLWLEAVGDDIRDVETGTVWDPVRGRGLSGPLAGEFLDILPAFTAFPWDYLTFWPDGRFWEPPATAEGPLPRFPLNLRD